ncbi:hypothetical protein SUDANB96_00389 [Streptomyces sp. enrichment culture]
MLVCGLVLGGCTGGDGGGGDTAPRPGAASSAAGGRPSAPPSPLPADAPTETADPARSPRTGPQAMTLIRQVIADEHTVGNGARRGTPYESDPATWGVLGEDCGWRREPLPADVLADLRRNFEVPGTGDVPGLRLTATVTVHRTALDAAWEQARMMEEALACPRQVLGAGEELTGLASGAFAWGEGNNTFADDSLVEDGECRSDTRGGPHPYAWTQVVYGPVVISASFCGGAEETREAAMDLVRNYLLVMMRAVKDRIGRPVTGEGA